MKYIKKLLVLFFLLFSSISFAGLLPAKKETFPFLAEIISKNVNVRAGQSANFESLCRLNKGDKVVVVGHEYSWYKIQLPSSANSFISDKYVLIKGSKGIITAKDVNIRAGAGINSTILKQLSLGDEVIVLDKKEGWLKITPVAQTFGWVADSLVTFQSKDISGYVLSSTPADIIKSVDPDAKTHPVDGSVKKILIAGKLKKLEVAGASDLTYQITIGNQPVYYIKAAAHRFDALLNQQVSIEGTVDPQFQTNDPYPVLVISKIQLIF